MGTIKLNSRRTSVDLDDSTFEALARIKIFYSYTTMAQAIRKATAIADDVIKFGAETTHINEEGEKIRTRYL